MAVSAAATWTVQLRPRDKASPERELAPYNEFRIKNNGKDSHLLDTNSLGLGLAWLQLNSSVPRNPNVHWPYLGHLITKSIENFNLEQCRKGSLTRRKFLYLLRHGEASHNWLKKVLGHLWVVSSRSMTPGFLSDYVQMIISMYLF